MSQSQSAKALDAWCKAERGRAEKLSSALGITATSINHYRRGVITPKGEKRSAIETITEGAVRADGWVEAEPVSVAELDRTPSPTFDATGTGG